MARGGWEVEERKKDPAETRPVRLKGWRRPRRPNDPDRTAENRARGWGGRRPGAGAPKGNLNALKHGRYSRYQRELIEAMLQVPEVREIMIKISGRQRAQTRRAEQGAAALMSELVRRVGRLAIHPEDDHLEDIQEFLAAIRSAEAELQKILEKQSRRQARN
jgi:hypothetical protein